MPPIELLSSPLPEAESGGGPGVPQEFLQLAAPDIHDAIDWADPYEALDTELQAILPTPDRSRKLFVDRLYRVVLLDGETAKGQAAGQPRRSPP